MGKAKQEPANELAKTSDMESIFGANIADALKETLNTDYSDTRSIKLADNTYVDHTVFHLSKKMGNVTDKVIANEDLKHITNTILGLNEVVKHSARLVAVQLKKADELLDGDGNKVLLNEGFKSVAEYGFYMFGIKDKTVNQYVRIARLFYDDKGNAKVEGLPRLTTSQCIPLLARVDDESTGDISTIVSWFTPDDDGNSLLTGGMGASKIKERLDSLDKGYVDKFGRSLLTVEERKERKAQEDAEKAQETLQAEVNVKEEPTETKASKVLTPEQSIVALYLKALSALEDFTETADETKKPAFKAIAEKLEALKSEVLALADIEE